MVSLLPLGEDLLKNAHRKVQTGIEEEILLMTSTGHSYPVGRLDFSVI